MTEPIRRQGLQLLGLGAPACATCCSGPILAFLGGLTVAGLASAFILGGVGLLVAVTAGIAFVVIRRRRRQAACPAGPTEPVLVSSPKPKGHPVKARTAARLAAALFVLTAALFAIGVATEREGHSETAPEVARESGESTAVFGMMSSRPPP